MSVGTKGNTVVSIEQSAEFIPNMAALHPETIIQVYREWKPATGKVEITVFYREPGEEKMRIDAEIDEAAVASGEISYKNVKIISWGPAVKAVQ